MLGIFKDKNGVTFGRPIGHGEYEGEGLPALEDGLPHVHEFKVTYNIRLSHKGDGDVDLAIAGRNTGRHFRFPIFGLGKDQARMAGFNFRERLNNMIVLHAIYPLFWACYREQDEDAEAQKESYDKIMDNFKVYFERMLRPKRFKVVETREENGIRVTKSEPIEGGRKPKPQASIDKEKLRFKKAVFDALDVIKIEGGKRTQTDVGNLVFENESDAKENADIPSRMRHALKRFDLNYKRLLKQYDLK